MPCRRRRGAKEYAIFKGNKCVVTVLIYVIVVLSVIVADHLIIIHIGGGGGGGSGARRIDSPPDRTGSSSTPIHTPIPFRFAPRSFHLKVIFLLHRKEKLSQEWCLVL